MTDTTNHTPENGAAPHAPDSSAEKYPPDAHDFKEWLRLIHEVRGQLESAASVTKRQPPSEEYFAHAAAALLAETMQSKSRLNALLDKVPRVYYKKEALFLVMQELKGELDAIAHAPDEQLSEETQAAAGVASHLMGMMKGPLEALENALEKAHRHKSLETQSSAPQEMLFAAKTLAHVVEMHPVEFKALGIAGNVFQDFLNAQEKMTKTNISLKPETVVTNGVKEVPDRAPSGLTDEQRAFGVF